MKTKPAHQNAFLPLSNIIHIDVFCQYIIIHRHTWWDRRNRLQKNCTGIWFCTLFPWKGIIRTIIDSGTLTTYTNKMHEAWQKLHFFSFILPLCLNVLVKKKKKYGISFSPILPLLSRVWGKPMEGFLIFHFFSAIQKSPSSK